ncbi:MAG: hypothetical protein ACRC7O_00225 [Fimbriiglobus sp.]
MATNTEDEWVHMEEATVVRVNEKAVCLSRDGKKHWIPISVISDDCHKNFVEGRTATFSLAAWFADRNGIDGD